MHVIQGGLKMSDSTGQHNPILASFRQVAEKLPRSTLQEAQIVDFCSSILNIAGILESEGHHITGMGLTKPKLDNNVCGRENIQTNATIVLNGKSDDILYTSLYLPTTAAVPDSEIYVSIFKISDISSQQVFVAGDPGKLETWKKPTPTELSEKLNAIEHIERILDGQDWKTKIFASCEGFSVGETSPCRPLQPFTQKEAGKYLDGPSGVGNKTSCSP